MDVGNTAKKILSSAEDHATLLTFAASNYLRYYENSTDPGTILSRLATYWTFQSPNNVDGNPLGNFVMSITQPTQLAWKLWNAPHYPTQIFKASAIIWAVGKLTGIIPEKYTRLAGKVATGSGVAALLLPGSGPGETVGNLNMGLNQQTGTYTSTPLQGSTLNQAPGGQPVANYMSVYPTNPTAGALYTQASGQRLIGN